VFDIIEVFGYNEASFDNIGYGVYLEEYIKKILTYLEEKKPDRVPGFKIGVKEMSSCFMDKFNEFCLYYP
jgi:predicted secreted protein